MEGPRTWISGWLPSHIGVLGGPLIAPQEHPPGVPPYSGAVKPEHLSVAEAVAALQSAPESRLICLGAEGFWLDNDGHRPSLEHILDLSEVKPRNPRTNASIALKAIESWPEDPSKFSVELVMVSAAYPCPCCGHLTLGEPPGSYEICVVCFWEDDAVQLRWPTYEGGANRPNLIDSQRAYAEQGAMEYRFTGLVRQPTEAEAREDGWRPIDPTRDSFEGRGVQEAAWPSDLTTLYWWRPTFWRSQKSASSP